MKYKKLFEIVYSQNQKARHFGSLVEMWRKTEAVLSMRQPVFLLAKCARKLMDDDFIAIKGGRKDTINGIF